MGHFYFIIPVGTAIWVGIDASNLGFSRGRLGGGFLDMGVAGYVLSTLIIWIIGFPCYLVARSRYLTMNRGGAYPAPAYGAMPPQYGAPQPYGVMPNPQFGMTMATSAYGAPIGSVARPATAPPQFSPDGQWWWNGQQWTPANGTVAPPTA